MIHSNELEESITHKTTRFQERFEKINALESNCFNMFGLNKLIFHVTLFVFITILMLVNYYMSTSTYLRP